MTRVRVAALVVLIALGLATAGGSLAGWLFLHGQPDWYRRAGGSQTSAGAAEQMEAKLIHLYNRVAAVHAWRVRQAASVRQTQFTAASVSSRPAEQPFEITFSDAELNAFFDKWADTADRRAAMGAYVEDPRLQIRPGEMILAARVKRFHTVISLELEPALDAEGRLRLNLNRVYGGILPLPEALWSSERDQLVQMMDEKYAELQSAVEIGPDGTANAAASAAVMNRLLVATLQHQSAEPVIFLPYDLSRLARTVPTQVEAVHLGDGTLTLNVREMAADERAALLLRIRGTAPHALASVR